MKILQPKTDLGLLFLRVSVGAMMLLHGIFKIFHGIGFIKQMVLAANLPAFLAYGVFLGEVVAPLLLIVGYRARLAAMMLAGNCVVAGMLAHRGTLLQLTPQGGWALELLGLYFFGALTVALAGAGKYAVRHKSWMD